MKCWSLVSIGSAVVLAVGLTGCAGDIRKGPVNATNKATAGPKAASTSAPRVVIDGQVRKVANEVACVDAAEMVFVNIGSNDDGIAARLTSGDSPTVQSLVLGTSDEGLPLMYNESRGGTPPTVTKSGLDYTIVGTTSRTSGDKVVKPFELEFTCDK